MGWLGKDVSNMDGCRSLLDKGDAHMWSPVSLQLLNAKVTLRWEASGCLQDLWSPWELSSAHWAAVPVHRRWGLQLRSESQAMPGSRSKRLRSWLGVRVCPLPGLSSFALPFRGKMVARAAMWKRGPQGHLHRFSKNRLLLSFSKALELLTEYVEHLAKGGYHQA